MICVCHFCGPFDYAVPPESTIDQMSWARQAAVFDHLGLQTHKTMVDLAAELEYQYGR